MPDPGPPDHSPAALPPPPPPPAAPPTSEPSAAPVAPAPARAERVLARRPGLPGGRAVVGALLVVSAGVATFALATNDGGGPDTSYAVLTRAVDPGRPVGTDDVAWLPMTLDRDVAQASFAEPDEIRDAVALVPLAPGQLLQRGMVATGTGPDDGSSAAGQLTIPVPLERTPPGLRRGERVALLATYGSGSDATTVVTVQSATVLAHETDAGSIGASSAGRLTLSLADSAAVVATAHAAQVAELTVVRTNDAAGALPPSYRTASPGGSSDAEVAP